MTDADFACRMIDRMLDRRNERFAGAPPAETFGADLAALVDAMEAATEGQVTAELREACVDLAATLCEMATDPTH